MVGNEQAVGLFVLGGESVPNEPLKTLRSAETSAKRAADGRQEVV